MIDFRYKPIWLPQISAPINYIGNKLSHDDINYEFIKVSPKKLKPLQGIVLSEKVSNINLNKSKLIWIANDYSILDGHHRYASALSYNIPYVTAIFVDLPYKDACRVLNKIIDIYKYEIQKQVEEVVSQTQINALNDPDVDPENFLEILDYESNNDQQIISDDKNIVGNKKKKMVAYRKEPLKENSLVGNYFSLKPIDGYKKYNIEFDNLLDTNDMGLTYQDDNYPVLKLAKLWFPNIDFHKVAKKYNINPNLFINRAVAEKAKDMRYDGIKYGDIMIQGFK